MLDLFSASQPTLDFPAALTERYRPHTTAEFVGLAKPKAFCAKLAARPYPSAWRGDRPMTPETPANPAPIAPKFVAVGQSVLQGARLIARAISHTMARRIAAALNCHSAGRKGY